MKKILICILLSISSLTFAAPTPNTIHVNVNVDYAATNGAHHYTIKNDFDVDSDNQEWVVTENNTAKPNPLLLLSRVIHADQEAVELKFLLIDTEVKPGAPLAARLIVRYGQTGTIHKNENGEKVDLTVVASK